MNDGLRRRDRPEAVTEHERIRDKQEYCDPGQRRHRDDRSVGAGEHQILSGDSRTGMASAGENSSSTCWCATPVLAVRSDQHQSIGTFDAD